MQPSQVPLRPPFNPGIRQPTQQWSPAIQQHQMQQQMVNVQRPVVPMAQPQPAALPQPQLEQGKTPKKSQISKSLLMTYFFSVPRVLQIPPPPTPPDNIVTEQDRQTVIAYEQWLSGQHQSLANQLQNLEMQVSKFRKAKKVNKFGLTAGSVTIL
jgi:hypothetical protein